jgi:DNA-binding transcriptional regulator LsrR (DeoR family)
VPFWSASARRSARTSSSSRSRLFDDPHTKQLLWRERSIRRVVDAQARVQVFVFGLGSPQADVPSHVYAGGYLTGEDLRMLLRDGVVGDCATVFYRLDGSTSASSSTTARAGLPSTSSAASRVACAPCRACRRSTRCAARWRRG